MKFMTVEELQRQPGAALRDLAPEEEWVVTESGHPVAILAPVREEHLEEVLVALRRARALTAVHELQRRSAELGTADLSCEEIEAEIRAARRARPHSTST
jgi:antitoxin (DNA-binding transcriptional repressor) of toxin-antitoxin stability system